MPTIDSIASGGAHASSVTVAITVANNSNRALYVCVSWLDLVSGTDDITSVTHNGNACTNVIEFDGQLAAFSAAIYRIIAPTTGTNNVVVTFTNTVDAYVGVASVYDVDQTTPEADAQVAHSSSGNLSVTVSGAAGQLVLDVGSCYNSISTPGAGQTQQWNGAGGSNTAGAGSTKAGGSSVTCTWTNAGGFSWAHAAVSIKPPGGGGGSVLGSYYYRLVAGMES